MRCGYICVWKSPPSIGLFLGRDEVERVFEVSSGGHRGRDIPQCTCMDSIYSHYYYGGTLCSVMCFLSAWVLHIVIITLADRRYSSHANRRNGAKKKAI